jgi:hypothetical protein
MARPYESRTIDQGVHMRMLRKAAFGCILGAAVLVPAGAAAAATNPSGHGLPSQSCQDIEAAGGTTPGHAASSPGSPFNEPGINSENGGIGGQHYSETSQYDVACFQVSSR